MSKIRVENISKKYCFSAEADSKYNFREYLNHKLHLLFRKKPERINNETFWALKNISFELQEGDVLGVIGRNGSGKSTLLKILSRITNPTYGSISFKGRLASLLEVGTGFHRELTGRENIFFNGAVLGMKHAEIKKKFHEIVFFSGVENFLNVPVKRYSSGMLLRLAFSVAAHLDPDILIIDEVLAVGDLDFQKKCLKVMDDLSTTGRTIIFVSHSIASIQRLCKKILFLNKGEMISFGNTSEVLSDYIHYEKNIKSEWIVGEKNYIGVPSLISFISIRALNNSNSINQDFSIHEPVKIEIIYELYGIYSSLVVGIQVSNVEGQLLFMSLEDFSSSTERQQEKGIYKSSCTISADILNNGEFFVTLLVFEDYAREIYRIENIISFSVIDEMIIGKGARGNFKNEWPLAIVRPALKWNIEKQGNIKWSH